MQYDIHFIGQFEMFKLKGVKQMNINLLITVSFHYDTVFIVYFTVFSFNLNQGNEQKSGDKCYTIMRLDIICSVTTFGSKWTKKMKRNMVIYVLLQCDAGSAQ